MKIFIPNSRYHMPHMDPEILTSMLVEIDGKGLDDALNYWEKIDAVSSSRPSAKLFSTYAKEICAQKPKRHTLEPFLRRPHVTLHGGSKEKLWPRKRWPE